MSGSAYDIGFADSNAAAQSTGFSFVGGGKNSPWAIAIVAGVTFIAAATFAWLLFGRRKKS
jgi:hypothetical protein